MIFDTNAKHLPSNISWIQCFSYSRAYLTCRHTPIRLKSSHDRVVIVDYSSIQSDGDMIPIIKPRWGFSAVSFFVVCNGLSQRLGLTVHHVGKLLSGILDEDFNWVFLAARWAEGTINPELCMGHWMQNC